MHTRTAFAILSAPILLVAHALASQTPRAIALGKPAAELHDTFTSVSSLRELSDGRVIVSDSRDKLVQLADFTTQKLVKIGRDGSGPGEFKSAGKLSALPNDTTLLEDFANNRFLVINGAGTPVAVRTENLAPYQNASSVGFDERGVWILTVRPKDARGDGGPEIMLRFDPRTKHVDTLTTMLRPTGLQSGASTVGNGMLKLFTNLPFAPQDAAAVSRDGRVVVARAENYHVEWFARDGKKIVGPTVNFTPIEINTAEKRAFLEKQLRPGSITVQNNPAANSRPAPSSGNKALYTAETYDDKGMTWPARKPPFVGNAISIDGAGRAWVLRTTVSTAPALAFDVFDASGKLQLVVTLPPQTKLAGFGAKSVYLAFNDEDDLQHLQRYALPQ